MYTKNACNLIQINGQRNSKDEKNEKQLIKILMF